MEIVCCSFSLWYLWTAGLANEYTFPATGRLSGLCFRGWAVYMPTLNQLEEAKHLLSECRQNKCSAMLSQFPKLNYWSDHSPQKDRNGLCPANPCPSLWKQKAKALSATNKASFGFSVLWKIWRLVYVLEQTKDQYSRKLVWKWPVTPLIEQEVLAEARMDFWSALALPKILSYWGSSLEPVLQNWGLSTPYTSIHRGPGTLHACNSQGEGPQC